MKKGSEFKLEEVKELINKGREDGILTNEEISDTLSEIDLTKEQIDNIYDVIANLGIEVINEEDEDIDSLIQKKKDVMGDILKIKMVAKQDIYNVLDAKQKASYTEMATQCEEMRLS